MNNEKIKNDHDNLSKIIKEANRFLDEYSDISKNRNFKIMEILGYSDAIKKLSDKLRDSYFETLKEENIEERKRSGIY